MQLIRQVEALPDAAPEQWAQAERLLMERAPDLLDALGLEVTR